MRFDLLCQYPGLELIASRKKITSPIRMKRYQLLGLVLSAGLVVTSPSKAVILYGTNDPSINTTAPGGELAGSGWQYEGQLNAAFIGTVIASNYFVTANHIGGNVGELFFFNGNSYTTTAVFQLAILRSGRLQRPFHFGHRCIAVRQVVKLVSVWSFWARDAARRSSVCWHRFSPGWLGMGRVRFCAALGH